MAIPNPWSTKPNPPTKSPGDMGTFLSLSKSSTAFWLHASEAVLFGFGVLLVIGLIGEIKVPWWNSWFRKFELLLIIRVAGELIGDGGVFIFSEHLQTIADAEVKTAITQAGEARTSAGKAEERAGKATERASKADERSEALRKDNLRLQVEVLNLQKRLAWRRITEEQHDRFVLVLKPYAGSFVKINGMGNGDLESETFAKDIKKLLHDAHWNVNLDFSNVALPAPVGLNCRVDDRNAAGETLAEVLKGLPTAVISSTPLAGAIAFITVGLRPPP